MSSANAPDAVKSGQGPEEKVDASSGYHSGGEDDKTAASSAKERRKEELAAREKLKEELLRQYEAGQLKADKDPNCQTGPTTGDVQKLLREYKIDGERQPRQIPTIEEQRGDRAAYVRRSVAVPRQAVSVPRSLPDLSRPPPGYVYPIRTVQMPFYQPAPQPIYNYEDTIVTRVLQSLMGSRNQHQQSQMELPSLQSQEALSKVLSWDVDGGRKGDLSEVSRSSLKEARSFSKEGRKSKSRERSRERVKKSKRRRSLSIESVSRLARPSSRRKRSRSRGRLVKKIKGESPRSKKSRDKSVERLLKRSNEHLHHSYTRETSPLTKVIRTCPISTEKSNYVKRRYDESYSAGNSPRSRKILLLSPLRVKKSVREVIMDERDMRLGDEFQVKIRSPVKKSVKDRLGVRNEDPPEVFNMDISKGRCGAVAIVKEYIDSKTGIMELKTSEGGRGAVILFSAQEVWIPDR